MFKVYKGLDINHLTEDYCTCSPWRISGNTQTHFANFSGTYHTLIERKSYIMEKKWTFLFAGTHLRFRFFANGLEEKGVKKEYPTNKKIHPPSQKYDLWCIILFNSLLPVSKRGWKRWNFNFFLFNIFFHWKMLPIDLS